ncbi:hypothetical protein FF1_035118 [Malus domestica]
MGLWCTKSRRRVVERVGEELQRVEEKAVEVHVGTKSRSSPLIKEFAIDEQLDALYRGRLDERVGSRGAVEITPHGCCFLWSSRSAFCFVCLF